MKRTTYSLERFIDSVNGLSSPLRQVTHRILHSVVSVDHFFLSFGKQIKAVLQVSFAMIEFSGRLFLIFQQQFCSPLGQLIALARTFSGSGESLF